MSLDEKVLEFVNKNPEADEETIVKALDSDILSVMDSLIRLEKDGKIKAEDEE